MWIFRLGSQDYYNLRQFEEYDSAYNTGYELAEEWKEDFFWTGRLEPVSIRQINPFCLLEDIRDEIEDEADEFDTNWPKWTKDEAEDLGRLLNDAFEQWVDKYGKRRGFFRIVDEKKHVIATVLQPAVTSVYTPIELFEAGRKVMLAQVKECQFELYSSNCGKPTKEDGLCEHHLGMKCAGCGGQAVRECDECLQLVCGAPLCSNCQHQYKDGINGHGPKN